MKASDTDVNVIAWNKFTSNIIASGDEKGIIRSFDLKMLKKNDENIEPVAQFSYHTDQITGLEWSPYDSSIFASCSSDGQTTIWDLSVEKEEEEKGIDGIPPQLMFVHMGQINPKEVHWHPVIKNLIGTTAENGLNLFIPSNLE
jgi:ribosome assembly protein RRB1